MTKPKPAKTKIINQTDWLWNRTPPIRIRKKYTTSWIKLIITEGKNRQIRRMTTHVGFPTLRLIISQIGDWQLLVSRPLPTTLFRPSQLVKKHIINQLREPFNIEARKIANFSQQELDYLQS